METPPRATSVLSEDWASWSGKALGEIDTSMHNKLSSRSRKSVDDILEAAKRRQVSSEKLLEEQASARAEKVRTAREHEDEVRQRNDDSIRAIGETSARKMASAEATRAQRLEQQAERLRRDNERAEAVRQRKMQQTEDSQRHLDGGTPQPGGEGAASSAGGEELLIDLPWTMFGEKSSSAAAPASPSKGGSSSSGAGAGAEAPFTPPRKENTLHEKLSSRERKTPEQILQNSARRMEAAAKNLDAKDAQNSARIAREREKAEKVKERHQTALDDLSTASAHRMAAAEGKRLAKLQEQQSRLQKDKDRAEEVRRRRLESPEKAGKPAADSTETPAGSPSAGAESSEAKRRAVAVASMGGGGSPSSARSPEPLPFKAEMEMDAEGKPLVMDVPAGAWVEKRSARGAEMHEKLSARTRKGPEEIMEQHKRRQAAAEALRRAREAKERQRIEKARAHEDQVRLRIETQSDSKAAAAGARSEAKMQTADQIAKRKAARESLRAERKRQREKSAKARQQNATRTFGSTMLDDDDKLRLLKIVKENKLAELEEMATGGELGRLRNFQNHYGDSALILAAWYGHIDIAKLLLDVNADVDIANCDGNTALNCAAYRGHHAMVELLLIEGSEVDVQDNVTGKTALIKAAYGGHFKVVRMLLEAEADPDAIDSQGYGALAFAASFGHKEVLNELLEYDADPDVADQFGITPLIHAAARGDFLSVKMLLENGATPTHEDIEGKSAIDYADSAGFDDVVQILAEFADRDPNSAGLLLSSAGAVTQRIKEAEEGAHGVMTNRGMESSREYSTTARGASTGQMSDRAYGSAAYGTTPRSARGGGPVLTPRMPPPMPSNRLRVPLGQLGVPGGGDMANSLGSPRGFRGMKETPQTNAECGKILPVDVAKVDNKTMTYLAKKLFNLSMLLEQDTVSEDVSYPKFAGAVC